MAGFGFQSLIQLFLLLAHISGAARTGRSPQYLKEVPNIWQARPVLASRSPCGALSASKRNYNTMKNKKNTPDRLELNKYCPFCRKHTVHNETK